LVLNWAGSVEVVEVDKGRMKMVVEGEMEL